METKKTPAETQGVEAEREPRYQFTLKEVKELGQEPKLIDIIESLSKDEMNKGKAGSYLLAIAKGIIRQLNLL